MNSYSISRKYHLAILYGIKANSDEVEDYFLSGLASRVPFHRASTPEILKPHLNGLHNLTTYENCKISLKHYNYLLSIGGTGAFALFQAHLLVRV
jgi:hypothetical protein